MKTIQIDKLSQYIDFIGQNCIRSTIYRGVKDEEHQLIPYIGRINDLTKSKEKNKAKMLDIEKQTMRIFKAQSYQYHKIMNIPEIELLALAQHHGLKTRLLDWTISPLVALFYAIESDKSDSNSAIYAFNN